MFDSNRSKVIIINFISAIIISIVVCYFLKTLNLTEVMYIGNLFGLYFLVIYGIDILVASGDIENNYKKFIYAIVFMLVFDILFLIIVPLIFGNVLSTVDYLTFIFNGAQVNLILNVPIYLAIFAVLMLIFNLMLYFKDKKTYSGE